MALSPVTRRYRRYKMQRAASAAVAQALQRAPNILGMAKHRRIQVVARRIAACAASTTIKLLTPPGDASRIVYRNKRRCRVGLCMPCARVRAKEANQRIAVRLDAILAEAPQNRFIFLTVTSRNRSVAEVANMLADHERALNRFWRSNEIARAITGHVTGIEIALRGSNDAREAGVHSHTVAAVHPDYFDRKADLYLSQRRLVHLWRRALRADYNPICHVTAVPAGDNVRASLRECVKYAVAPHKLFERGNAKTVDPLVALYLADALYKRRLIRFGGVFATTRRYRAAKAMAAKPSNP
ncbi:protein rep [Hyphomicrobium sp. LHD-15]|uniref:protein rep n=1 Tax=Hyphomicrobium sp. LHD-15 TaxID=3072142 RepID=UPI0028106651|nr:protein rep [Hyphomicrobium sp. LHD-15]MDQ8699263.1 protein rep [Hyphomicrobium sp. LHD-15]